MNKGSILPGSRKCLLSCKGYSTRFCISRVQRIPQPTLCLAVATQSKYSRRHLCHMIGYLRWLQVIKLIRRHRLFSPSYPYSQTVVLHILYRMVFSDRSPRYGSALMWHFNAESWKPPFQPSGWSFRRADNLYQNQATFFWKGMKRDIWNFVQSCTICLQSKPDRAKYPGLL